MLRRSLYRGVPCGARRNSDVFQRMRGARHLNLTELSALPMPTTSVENSGDGQSTTGDIYLDNYWVVLGARERFFVESRDPTCRRHA